MLNDRFDPPQQILRLPCIIDGVVVCRLHRWNPMLVAYELMPEETSDGKSEHDD